MSDEQKKTEELQKQIRLLQQKRESLQEAVDAADKLREAYLEGAKALQDQKQFADLDNTDIGTALQKNKRS